MFERYTEKARRTIFFARYEASQYGSLSIETEHLLLGLLRENHALSRYRRPDSSAESIRRRIEKEIKFHEKISIAEDLPLSPECKRALAYGIEEAERLNHASIATDHLLVGLLREEKCFAAKILKEEGVEIQGVREEIARSGLTETGGFAGGGVGIGRGGPGIPRPPGVTFGREPGMAWMPLLQDAARVLQLARHQAVLRHSPAIETTDLLMALTIEKEIAERFLDSADRIRKGGEARPAPLGERVSEAELPFSEDCKEAFNFAAEEAARLGQRTGPAHLLLGILRVNDCGAAKILRDCGVTAAEIRARLLPPPPPSDPEQGRSYV